MSHAALGLVLFMLLVSETNENAMVGDENVYVGESRSEIERDD